MTKECECAIDERYEWNSASLSVARIPRIVRQTMTIKRHDNQWCVMCGLVLHLSFWPVCVSHGKSPKMVNSPYQCIWLMEPQTALVLCRLATELRSAIRPTLGVFKQRERESADRFSRIDLESATQDVEILSLREWSSRCKTTTFECIEMRTTGNFFLFAYRPAAGNIE